MKDILEMISYGVTILGIPFGIIGYLVSKRKEREEREYGTYDALDNKYVEFLTICLENPDLKIGSEEDIDKRTFTADQISKREVIYEILICMLERAYLMYKRNTSHSREKQWAGWDKYIDYWMLDAEFKKMWSDPDFQRQYSTDFVDYMRVK